MSSRLSTIDFASAQAVPDAVSLPVVYSTFDSQALKFFICDYYVIETPLFCHLWHRGLSDVYLVETDRKTYVLRISHHHWRTKAEIEFEMDFLAFLAQNNLPIAAPIPSKQGELAIAIQAPEGSRYASLFPYAEGEVAMGDWNAVQAYQLGKILAKVHQTAQDFDSPRVRPPLNASYLVDDPWHVLSPFFQHRLGEWEEIQIAIAKIKQQISHLPTEAPYWTVCWGDPPSGNVHLTADNQPTLFDFDQCGQGWRVFDIAKFLQTALQTGLCQTVRNSLIGGYQSVEPLTEIEMACLQPLTQAAYLWSWAINVNSLSRYDNSRLCDRYFSKRLDCFRHLSSNGCQLF